MDQMRYCADTYVRVASVARGAIEPKGAAGTAQGIFWKSPLPSACRRGTMAPDYETKLPNEANSVALGTPRTRPNRAERESQPKVARRVAAEAASNQGESR